MEERHKAWTENLPGAAQSLDDVMSGLGGLDDIRKVTESPSREGVWYVGDCRGCGKQWKSIIKWPEIARFYLGQPVEHTKPIASGVLLFLPCISCRTVTPILVEWMSVRNYVEHGVQARALPPQILGRGHR